MKRPSPKTLGLGLIIFLAWASVLEQVFTHFDPGSSQVTGWHSDTAIPVLQSNDPVFDTFRLYYYGQDRIGAWPWLVAQAWRALTGFDWTPYRLFLWQATWACAACLALLGLHRRAGLLLAASFAALALLSPLFQRQLFGLSQPFGWQLTALLFAWWTLTRFIEGLGAPQKGWAVLGWGLLATLFSTMACWTSPTSGPLLLVCLMVQGVRAGVMSPVGSRRWRLVLSLLPLVVGIGFEARVRAVYHHFSMRHFGSSYRTNMQLDIAHFQDNARAVISRILEHELGPIVFFGLGTGLVALGFLLHHLRRRTLAAKAEQAELAALTLALAGAALANALITAVVLHARINGHDIRYLVPTMALGVLAAVTGAIFLLGWVPGLQSRLGMICGGLAALFVVGSHLLIRPRIPDGFLERTQAITDEVVTRAEGAVLLGDYWDTYLLGALDPAHRLPTVVMDGDTQRTPFWLPKLREAKHVLVSIFQSQRLGTAEQPSPWLLQAGVPFQLSEPRWASHPPFHFARYRSVREHTLPVRLDPERGFDPCKPGRSITVHFQRPVERGLLLVSTSAPPNTIEVEAPEGAEARLEGLPSLWLLRLSSGAQPLGQLTLRVRPDVKEEYCWFSGAALVLDSQLASDGAPENRLGDTTP